MKIARYAFNPLNRTLAASPAFLKNASRLGSMEYQIIRQLRADYAGKMILAGKKTADVAADLGYLSARNFSRAFMNFYQCTPVEYRKKFFGEEQ